MDDRYREDFSTLDVEYSYPFTWEARNKDYLELREDRNKEWEKPEWWREEE